MDSDVPLHYVPGQAYQFDWSHEVVAISGVTVTVKVAHDVRPTIDAREPRHGV